MAKMKSYDCKWEKEINGICTNIESTICGKACSLLTQKECRLFEKTENHKVILDLSYTEIGNLLDKDKLDKQIECDNCGNNIDLLVKIRRERKC